MSGGFTFRPQALAELEASAQGQHSLQEIAQRVIDEVRAVWESEGPHPYDEGTYLADLAIEERDGKVYVVANDPVSVYVELGTGGDSPTPAFHTLVRALEAVGLHVTNGR